MSNVPHGAKTLASLAKRVGGRDGRALTAAVEAALNSDTPDLDIRTKMASAQIPEALRALGGYASGPVPLRIKKRMRKDGQIRFALAAAKAPILSAPLHFDTRSAELRELLRQVFLDSGFVRGLMESSLAAIEYGFQAQEQIWVRSEDYKVEWGVPSENGGEEVEEKSYPTLYEPRTFKDLDPELTQLIWDDAGTFKGLAFGSPDRYANLNELQKAVSDKKVNVLGTDKTFLFTPILEYQNYYGEGRLDWAYDHWYWGNILYLVAMRWYERKADPPWVGYAPSSAETVPDPEGETDDSPDDAEARQDTLGAVSRAMSRLRNGGSVALPSEVYADEDGRPSNTRIWEIKEMEVRDIHPAFLDMIDHLDKKKARALLVPDTVISRDRQVASLGAVEAVTDVASKIQNAVLQRFVRAFNEQILSRFLAYNGFKDRATLVSTGIFEDNRSLLKDLILKAFEADMLIAQAGGTQPGSLAQIFDRKQACRAIGVPILEVDPDGPPPPMPTVPVAVTAPGKDTQSNNTGAKRGAKRDNGLSVDPEGGNRLDLAEDEFLLDMQREADRAEEWVQRQAKQNPYRETLSTGEKAVAAIFLWLMIRSQKQDAGGRKIAGDLRADNLVWNGGKLLPNATLAANFPALETLAGEYAGRGFSLDMTGSQQIVGRAKGAIQTSLDTMRSEMQQAHPIDQYLLQAVEQGRSAVQSAMERWDPARPFVNLDPEEVLGIVNTNTEALLLNVDNIARRNGNSLIEKALMAFSSRRELGMVQDILDFRFNNLYSDLTLEAHLRAAYRNAAVRIAEKSGLSGFVKVPAHGPRKDDEAASGNSLDYRVESAAWWSKEGERRGQPNPHTTFGFHHGSRSYWFPVPPQVRVRTEAARLSGGRSMAGEGMTINVNIPKDAISVKVEPSPVTVNLPPSPPPNVTVTPDIRVDVPAPTVVMQNPPAPQVTVRPDIRVTPAPENRPTQVRFTRDESGRISGAKVE